jgi:Flp pilus assembly protein TadB
LLSREDMAEASPSFSARSSKIGSGRAARIMGVVAVSTLLTSLLLALGMSAVVSLPLLLAAAIVMLAVWYARRKRQIMQGRDSSERLDRSSGLLRWPTKSIIDDRLPDEK